MTTPYDATINYGRQVLTRLPFSDEIDRVKVLLEGEGFGVLCDIDVASTMHKKLGESFRPYRILGACNPGLAHRALVAEPQIGLLLPCNLVVQEVEGQTFVSAVNARAMLGVVENHALSAIADEATASLERVLNAIAEGAS